MATNTPHTSKLLTVPLNGQISIGKKWAGRQICIEEIDENKVLISSGKFIPDSQATFYSAEASASLKEFNLWSAQNPPKQTPVDTLIARVLEKKKGRDKKKK